MATTKTPKRKTGKLSDADAARLFLQRARDHFPTYCCLMDPGYQLAPHLRILHAKLERIDAGLSKRDQTFMPPQHGKTRTASELFAAWYLGRHPDKNLLFVTYAQPLADTRGAAIRALIQDPKHQAIFPDCRITHDSNSKSEFVLTKGGGMKALGRGGDGTGRRADGIIVDDIIKNQAEADSDAIRLEVKGFYSGVVMSRMHNDTWVHIINTRWHLDDLSGWTLLEHEHENWNVLSLEAICEVHDPAQDPLGRNFGEALWPERQSLELLLAKKRSSTPRQWSALYQQNPVPEGGVIFKSEHFKTKAEVAAPGELPYFVVQSWDTAQKDGSKNDYTVCTTWELYKRGACLRHVLRTRVKSTELQQLVHSQAALHGPNLILIEDKSSGTQLVQTLKGDSSLPVLAINPTLKKELRFELAAVVFATRSIAIPAEGECEWSPDYRLEMCSVPAAKFDDQADSTTQFVLWYDGWVRSSQIIIKKSGKARLNNEFNGFNNA